MVFKNTLVESLKKSVRHKEERKRADKPDSLVERHSERSHEREEVVQGVGENKAVGGLQQIQNCKTT